MRGGIVLSNRLRAMQEAAENFGEGIDGIRMAQRKMAQEDEDRKAMAETRTLQTQAAKQNLELGGFQARAAQRQEQDALGLRNDMTALEGLDNGLPAFGPQQPGAEPQYMMKDPNAGLRNRLLASIETKLTGKPVSVADLEARKAEAATKRGRETQAFNTEQDKAKADIKETQARTGKLALEEKKIKAELDAIAKGGMDPEKAVAAEGKLRDSYLSQTKGFTDVHDAYGRVMASVKDPSPAGDVALIFNYMKMLDPGSTVREGEFATAETAGSIPTTILNKYNKAISGERLGETRSDFIKQAANLYEAAHRNYERNRKTYTDLAVSYKLEPSRVAIPLETAGIGQASAAPALAGNRDSEAVTWAKANPTDPRAAKILQLNGAR